MRPCSNCGAVVADVDGPTHAYMVSAPGCWAAFSELQADEVSRFGYPPVHGLAVDAFAASHGGDGEQRRDRQSVCIHLMALCAALERGRSPDGRTALLRNLTVTKSDWPQLPRPAEAPSLTHLHAAGAADLEDYTTKITQWARAVWKYWTPEHDRIRELVDTHPPRVQ